jgi:hypothetical protein
MWSNFKQHHDCVPRCLLVFLTSFGISSGLQSSLANARVLSQTARYCEATSPIATPRVVDSKAKVVGPLLFSAGGPLSASAALRNIDGTWFALPVTFTGFVTQSLTLYYASGDCSGTAYMITNGPRGLLADAESGVGLPAAIAGETLYYSPSVQSCSAASFDSSQGVSSDGTLGACSTFVSVGNPCYGGAVSTYDLGALELVPPFSIQSVDCRSAR